MWENNKKAGLPPLVAERFFHVFLAMNSMCLIRENVDSPSTTQNKKYIGGLLTHL